MKLFSSLVLVLITLSLNSCCGHTGYPAAVITIEYIGEFAEPQAYQAHTNRNDLSDTIYTSIVKGTYTKEGFKIVLSISENENNLILMPFDSSRVDTVSQINFSRGKCDEIENLEYHFNGDYKTDRDLILK